MIRRVKILWFNYRLMRLFGNGKTLALRKGWQMLQGKKVRVHPGRRRSDVKTV